MKRTIALLLALLLALSLFAGCSKKDSGKISADDIGQLTDKDAGKDTDTNTAKPDSGIVASPTPSIKPAETDNSNDANRYVGVWSGKSFKNDWSDISLTLTDGWEAVDALEVLEDYNHLEKDATLADYEKLDEIADAVCEYDTTGTEGNLVVGYIRTKLDPKTFLTEELLGDFTETQYVTEFYTSAIGGNSYTAFDARNNAGDSMAYLSVGCRKLDDDFVAVYILTLTTSDPGFDLESVLRGVFPDYSASAHKGFDETPTASASGLQPGVYTETGYVNDFAGLKFRIPENWHTATREEMDSNFTGSYVGELSAMPSGESYADAMLYSDKGEMIIVMYSKIEGSVHDGLSAEETAISIIKENGNEIDAQGEVNIGTRGDAYCVDYHDVDGYYTYVTFECDDGVMGIIIIGALDKATCDSLFEELFK